MSSDEIKMEVEMDKEKSDVKVGVETEKDGDEVKDEKIGWHTEYMQRAQSIEDEWDTKMEKITKMENWQHNLMQAMFIKLYRTSKFLGNKFKKDKGVQRTLRLILSMIVVTPELKNGSDSEVVTLKVNPFSKLDITSKSEIEAKQMIQKKVCTAWAACMKLNNRYVRIMWGDETVWAELEKDDNAKAFIGGLRIASKWDLLKMQNEKYVAQIFRAMHVINLHSWRVAGFARPPRSVFQDSIDQFREAMKRGDGESALKTMLETSFKGDFIANASQMMEAAGGLRQAREAMRKMATESPEAKTKLKADFMKMSSTMFDTLLDGAVATDAPKGTRTGKRSSSAAARRAAAKAARAKNAARASD